MDSGNLEVRTLPSIDIYVRHSLSCPISEGHAGGGDESYRRCKCWKHLRWRENGKLRREAMKCWDWAGAEVRQAGSIEEDGGECVRGSGSQGSRHRQGWRAVHRGQAPAGFEGKHDLEE